MRARGSSRVVRTLVLVTSVFTMAGGVWAVPASAAAKAVPVPAKADYTLVLSNPKDAGCGLSTVEGSSLAIRAGVATLVLPGGPKLTGSVHRKGVTFTVHASVKQILTTTLTLTGKVSASHLLIGKSDLVGFFVDGKPFACHYPFSGLPVPTAKTACPTSAALFAAWRAQKPPPGPFVTGFGRVTCWRTWAVANVQGQADGTAAFTRVPKLHLTTAAEGEAFHLQVCEIASAPKAWHSPDVSGCF
jgi:hypothetical protein